jgi:DNA ligase-associated metallophosphoesterase
MTGENGTPLQFVDVEMIATLGGALFWPLANTLIVADLHLEKGTSLAGRGAMIPPLDSRATLDRLREEIETFDPQRVICLGDSFHDAEAATRLKTEDADTLAELAEGRDWIWIVGNHDPTPQNLSCGDVASCVALGPLILRHEAAPAALAGEVSGHFHPKATVTVAGKRITARCFVTDGHRLILPAFGAYTGGLNVHDPAFSEILGAEFIVFVIGRQKVHLVSSKRLLAR